MKTALLILLCALTAFAVTLQWNSQPEADSFYIYHSIDLTNWSVLTNTTGTNVTLPLAPGIHFFKLTASNFWGESTFSSTVGTPSPATNPSGLAIRRFP